MVDNLVSNGNDYIMNDTFRRIKTGKHFDMNFKPYDEKFIRNVLKFFEDIEEFEKCQTLIDFINKRYNHDLNYNNKI